MLPGQGRFFIDSLPGLRDGFPGSQVKVSSHVVDGDKEADDERLPYPRQAICIAWRRASPVRQDPYHYYPTPGYGKHVVRIPSSGDGPMRYGGWKAAIPGTVRIRCTQEVFFYWKTGIFATRVVWRWG